MPQKIPLMILPRKLTNKISRIFIGLSAKLSKFVVGLKYDLTATDIDLSDAEYIAHSLVNSLMFFFLFFFLLSFLGKYVQQKTWGQSFGNGLLYGAVIFILIGYTLIRYPKILAGKKAELIDKYLLFALKDLKLQVTSGITLYNGLVNVSKAGYGRASMEFEKVARAVNTGREWLLNQNPHLQEEQRGS